MQMHGEIKRGKWRPFVAEEVTGSDRWIDGDDTGGPASLVLALQMNPRCQQMITDEYRELVDGYGDDLEDMS